MPKTFKPGTVRNWGGKPMVKKADGTWVPQMHISFEGKGKHRVFQVSAPHPETGYSVTVSRHSTAKQADTALALTTLDDVEQAVKRHDAPKTGWEGFSFARGAKSLAKDFAKRESREPIMFKELSEKLAAVVAELREEREFDESIDQIESILDEAGHHVDDEEFGPFAETVEAILTAEDTDPALREKVAPIWARIQQIAAAAE